jgi:23S rRNA pseudouridine1911/1915/1917 synthase
MNIPAITVLHETDDVVVINKPYGLLTHASGQNVAEEATVVDWFLAAYPAAAGIGDKHVRGVPTAAGQGSNTLIDRSGVVHRLDRETSGVMVLAKTAAAHAHLKEQFHDRTAKKEYRAFVYGHLRDRWGTINRPIGRSATDPRRRSAEPGSRGHAREAVTDFETIAKGEYMGESFSYAKLLPRTGRTHQLRVHLRALDRPIVGDTLYAEYKYKQTSTAEPRSNHLGCDRLMLHAHALTVLLPSASEPERFIAPLPHEFERAAERIENTEEAKD